MLKFTAEHEWLKLEGDVDTLFVTRTQDGTPAGAKLGEAFLYEARRALWPGIDIGPQQRAGKADGAAPGSRAADGR